MIDLINAAAEELDMPQGEVANPWPNVYGWIVCLVIDGLIALAGFGIGRLL